jgi:hypothetical protein
MSAHPPRNFDFVAFPTAATKRHFRARKRTPAPARPITAEPLEPRTLLSITYDGSFNAYYGPPPP